MSRFLGEEVNRAGLFAGVGTRDGGRPVEVDSNLVCRDLSVGRDTQVSTGVGVMPTCEEVVPHRVPLRAAPAPVQGVDWCGGSPWLAGFRG